MSTFLWVSLAVVYFACFFLLGLATFRKGHYVAAERVGARLHLDR